MNIRYRVTLTPEERQHLQALTRGGKGAVRQIKRAQILLAADAQMSDERIAVDVGRRHVDGVSDEAALRRGRPGARAQRSAPAGCAAEAQRQR